MWSKIDIAWKTKMKLATTVFGLVPSNTTAQKQFRNNVCIHGSPANTDNRRSMNTYLHAWCIPQDTLTLNILTLSEFIHILENTKPVPIFHKAPNLCMFKYTECILIKTLDIKGYQIHTPRNAELTHWPLGWCGHNFKLRIFNFISGDKLSISCWIALRWMQQGFMGWSFNTGSGNGLVSSSNKPLPEPVLSQIYVTMWHH